MVTFESPPPSISSGAAIAVNPFGYTDYDADVEKTIEHLSDNLLLKIFSFVKHSKLMDVALVCRKWRGLAYSGVLWQRLCLRPSHGGLNVTSVDTLVQLLALRFNQYLCYIELPCDLAIADVLHELAQKCPNLRSLTLDFSNAMQLHDYQDLLYFPNNLEYLCLCLSEVIFMEGFMRRIYANLGSLQVLHLIGTFELSDEKEEEVYEVINISKIRSHTPNLRVVNLYGINFVDDSHVDLLAGNCIHLETLALNFCLRVKGSGLKQLIFKCKKLRTLLMQHCELTDSHMRAVEWETSLVDELDISSTELSAETLLDVLSRMQSIRYLAVAHCDFFNDHVITRLNKRGKFKDLIALDVSHTAHLGEECLGVIIGEHGPWMLGFAATGKPTLGENFWCRALCRLPKLQILTMGYEYSWFYNLVSKIHVDQVVEHLASFCQDLYRLEMEWDPETIKFSEKSGKAIDHLRIRCTRLRSIALTDCAYFEMVKSNFERSERFQIVRTTTAYRTNLIGILTHYQELRFN